MLMREMKAWGLGNSFLIPVIGDAIDDATCHVIFNERDLPVEHITGETASGNNAVPTVVGNQKFQGMVYTKAGETSTDFSTSTDFLPNPAVINKVTFDIFCEFTVTDIGGTGTFIWNKGLTLFDNSSFTMGRNNSNQLTFGVRGDSGGGSEGNFGVNSPVTADVLGLTHFRGIYDGNKSLGFTIALYQDDMSTAVVSAADASSTLAGIENTTTNIMEFGMLTPTMTHGNCIIYEAMIRTGIHQEQVLTL